MSTSTKKAMGAWLPATPVQDSLREQVIEAASKEGISLSEFQRRALTLFLRQIATYSISNDTSIDNSAEVSA